MTSIYLRHRALTTDPWSEPPSIAALYPNTPVGALPAVKLRVESGPETETPCGCPGAGTTEDHLILKAELAPIASASAPAIISFLLRYKDAALFEAKSARYGQSAYMTAKLSQIVAKEVNGETMISFRLAAPITVALA